MKRFKFTPGSIEGVHHTKLANRYAIRGIVDRFTTAVNDIIKPIQIDILKY